LRSLRPGRVRSLRDLAERDGITRRYIRRIVGLAFLRPQLVEAILQGRRPIELTATRLTELDLPLGWAEQKETTRKLTYYPGLASTSRGLLDLIVRHITQMPAMLIATFRPEFEPPGRVKSM
jgi:hypothetical protein